ncbi:FAD:protein FMN transferase [Polynucleobacter sp. AP-Nino-20-G2]|uniref:FAD:protein FMN transferase n=1 Tax=Polynucleobacter sp. AP-Nino-20-G2 TaxID=2576917 RepID=UPI001BFD03EF|nr:FAD:protein FMN transferase [Polynucleobacter sp. AP-Nino-20-G2]QWE17000.1 FAD:protein FMN transferase [Polynucleobacter sp. AP-Nino-20-G2]
MIRCKPLLGTFVEISTAEVANAPKAIELAFSAIEKIQKLMAFHQVDSELSKINAGAHIAPIRIDPWTAKVLTTALEIYQHSDGLFNCGIGQHLVAAKLLPRHLNDQALQCGGIEHLQFLEPTLIYSHLPLCLDLGGIAKGFAVDMAIDALKYAGIPSGSVNAGGDIRVFGETMQAIELRNPSNPHELIRMGDMCEGAIATSSLYFAKRDSNTKSYMIDPISEEHIDFSGSYSVIAKECMHADALTKVVSISGNTHHPCLQLFSAQAIRISLQ